MSGDRLSKVPRRMWHFLSASQLVQLIQANLLCLLIEAQPHYHQRHFAFYLYWAQAEKLGRYDNSVSVLHTNLK